MRIAFFVFDGITALDAVGPYEVLARLPGAEVRFVAPERGAVRTDNRVLGLVADASIDDVTETDLLVLAGGFGTRALEKDERVKDWIRALDRGTTITAAVCTGSILLASTGLLTGRRASTHWAQRARLAAHGALPVPDRVVRDGKYATAAGVSAGIDLALVLAEELAGRDVAEAIQLSIEYDPAPHLRSGSPETARPQIHETVLARIRAREAQLAQP